MSLNEEQALICRYAINNILDKMSLTEDPSKFFETLTALGAEEDVEKWKEARPAWQLLKNLKLDGTNYD